MQFKKKEYHREEVCLNCHFPLIGPYCGKCGQKAFLKKDSFWHMAIHFVGDYFHYNSKFWTTFKTLILSPGKATLDYIEGKRVTYLNPIPLYIFVTSIFFLYSFNFNVNTHNGTVISFNSPNDSTHVNGIQDSMERAEYLRTQDSINKSLDNVFIAIGQFTPKETTREIYDSLQNTLPESERDGMIVRKLKQNSFVRAGYTKDSQWEYFKDKLKHNFPKIFFVLLPIFALIIGFIFRKQKLYFVDHIIFSIHFHVIIFILMFFRLLLFTFFENETFQKIIELLIFLGLTLYLFLSLKMVYKNHHFKTAIKQIVIFFSYFVIFFISLLGLAFFTLLFL